MQKKRSYSKKKVVLVTAATLGAGLVVTQAGNIYATPTTTSSALTTVKQTDATVSIQESLDNATKNLANQALNLLKQNYQFSQINIGLADDQATSDLVTKLQGKAASGLKDNGFLIKAGSVDGKKVLAIQGKDATGLFYALNQLISDLNNKQDINNLDLYESPQMSIRGVIEGFYGKPWSDQARKDLFKFMGEHRMNTYIYSPKDDKYLRENWREAYPQDKLNEIKSLVDEANKNHVEFVYALSPGNDITYSNEADYQATIKKFDQLKSIGVKQFYIALDDIVPALNDTDKKVYPVRDSANYKNNPWAPLADAQSSYLNKIQENYIDKNNLPALWLVPTNYSGSQQDPFKEAQGERLNKKIHMQWTGEGVFSGRITADSIAQAKKTYNTDNMFIWDNFPVNDSNQDRLYLNPTVGRASDLYTVTEGFTANPMIEPYASWIGIGSFADYMWDASTYNPNDSMEKVLKEIAGNDADLLKDLEAFVDLNQYWDHGDTADQVKAPVLSALVENYQKNPVGSLGHQQALNALQAQLQRIANTPTTLKNLAVNGFYTDSLAWINAASHWAKASLASLQINEAVANKNVNLVNLGQQLATIKNEVAQATVKAVPDGRTGSDEPAIVPTVGDGVFDSLVATSYQQVSQVLNLKPLSLSATKLVATAQTKIPVYENNVVANMTDGNAETKFYSSQSINKGDTITLDLGKKQAIQRIVFQQGANDQATSGDILTDASVYVGNKADGSDKVEVGKITASGNCQIDLAKAVEGQYVFVIANTATSSWLQVREFSVYNNTGLSLTNLQSSQGIQNLFDGSIQTSYVANLTKSDAQGVIEQMTNQPMKGVTELTLVGQAKGNLYVHTNGQWQKVATLDGQQEINQVSLGGNAKARAVQTPITLDGVKLVLDPSSKETTLSEIGLTTVPVNDDSSKPGTGDTDKPKGDSDKGQTDKKPANKPNTNKGKLPQTGEQKTILASLAGIVLAGLAWFGFKRH